MSTRIFVGVGGERELPSSYVFVVFLVIFFFLYFAFLCYSSKDYETGYSPDVLGSVVVKNFHKEDRFSA